MKKTILLGVVLVAIIKAACGVEITGGDQIISSPVMATLGDTWTGQWGPFAIPVYILKAAIWVGESKGANTDTAFRLMIPNRSICLVFAGWDHYSDPDNINGNLREESFSPNYVTLYPGEIIQLAGAANSYGRYGYRVLTAAFLWWTTVQPN